MTGAQLHRRRGGGKERRRHPQDDRRHPQDDRRRACRDDGAFPIAGRSPISGVALLLLWGLAFGGVPVSVQTWIFKAAPEATEAATALNTSMFNLAIALGALAGGIVVDAVAVTGVLRVGALLAVATVLVVRGRPAEASTRR